MAVVDADGWIYDLFCRCLGLFALMSLYYYNYRKQSCRTIKPYSRKCSNPDNSSCGSKTCLRCNCKNALFNAVHIAEQLIARQPTSLRRIAQWLQQRGSEPKWESPYKRPNVFYLPDLVSSPLVDRKMYEHDVRILENSWRTVEKEYCDIAETCGDASGWTLNSTPEGRWSVFYLYNQGSKVVANADRCPNTMKLVSKLEHCMLHSGFGNVCFSVVEPGTTIAAHCGPCNIRTRCHLGLRTSPELVLVVAGQSIHWSQGKCVLFDDSYLHLVRPSSEYLALSSRAVLMIDLWNINLTDHEREALKLMFPPC